MCARAIWIATAFSCLGLGKGLSFAKTYPLDKNAFKSALADFSISKDWQQFSAFLKSYFHIQEVDQRIFPYLAGEVELEGHLLLLPFEKCYYDHYSFRHLFKDFSDNPFPAICIGGDGEGVDFYLMLETGKIISLHHDATFYEVACCINADSEEVFVRRFEEEGSTFHLRQLLDFQQITCRFDRSDYDFGEQLFLASAKALGLTLHQTAEIMHHDSFAFLATHFGDLWEEDDALEEFLMEHEPMN